jgi:hypothetical protein
MVLNAEIRVYFAAAWMGVDPGLELSHALVVGAEVAPILVFRDASPLGARRIDLPVIEDHLEQVIMEVAFNQDRPFAAIEPHALATSTKVKCERHTMADAHRCEDAVVFRTAFEARKLWRAGIRADARRGEVGRQMFSPGAVVGGSKPVAGAGRTDASDERVDELCHAQRLTWVTHRTVHRDTAVQDGGLSESA